MSEKLYVSLKARNLDRLQQYLARVILTEELSVADIKARALEVCRQIFPAAAGWDKHQVYLYDLEEVETITL